MPAWKAVRRPVCDYSIQRFTRCIGFDCQGVNAAAQLLVEGCIDEAMAAKEATKERWCEAEAHRVAGEIVLRSPQRDVAKAQAYFEHSLTVARAQQAKSWELRTAMSLARLLSDQGKRQSAHDLLAPVYDWFTEGFDTSDLRNAKALLGELC